RPQRKQIRNGFSVTDEAARLSGRTGTLVFMAPEVFKSENYNDKADVFSFAVVLYEVFHRQGTRPGPWPACCSGG
ncbi:protein kinase domain-containing protein, partial [Haematococcus lacustris]